jgi:hypothetical protein
MTPADSSYHYVKRFTISLGIYRFRIRYLFIRGKGDSIRLKKDKITLGSFGTSHCFSNGAVIEYSGNRGISRAKAD